MRRTIFFPGGGETMPSSPQPTIVFIKVNAIK
jgi:hypothetical protein